MATPKKDKKIRDSDVTRKRLIDCVGEIVRNEGFHEIGVNKIARLAENDKGLIRYHFGSLAGLLRTYIRERDYWPPFFERYKIDGSADQNEVREMFTALMQENLEQFFGDREMQKIILWQITEASPVLRQISEERENEGEKLLGLVDPTFAASGISFKAVIALLLGGSYFAVLQSQSIKSRVCGVDLNWERDFNTFRKTIGQIISWAWEKANVENRIADIPMNYELDRLEDLAEQVAGQGNVLELNEELAYEVKKVERALSAHLLTLTNETQIVTFLQVYIGRLVKLCNLLYDRERDQNPNAELILGLIETLRRPVSMYVPENIILPDIFRVREAAKFRTEWSFLLKPLQEKGTDAKLIDIMYVPLKQFISGKGEMKWSDFKYLRRYVSVLQDHTAGEFTSDTLMETLVGLGYNYTRFASYYTSRIRERAKLAEAGVPEDFLEEFKFRLKQISIYTKRDFDRYKQPILEELEKWVGGELARTKAKTKSSFNTMKLISRFKGVQLAFWKKLQYDHGVYEEDNLDVYSEKIAHNYSTKSQDDLSAASIKSKFYPKDRAIYRMVEKMLLAMLEDVRKFL